MLLFYSNQNLNTIPDFIVDNTTGQITGYKTTIEGADTVYPFKSGITHGSIVDYKTWTISSSSVLTVDYTLEHDGALWVNISLASSNDTPNTITVKHNNEVIDVEAFSYSGLGASMFVYIIDNVKVNDTLHVTASGTYVQYGRHTVHMFVSS